MPYTYVSASPNRGCFGCGGKKKVKRRRGCPYNRVCEDCSIRTINQVLSHRCTNCGARFFCTNCPTEMRGVPCIALRAFDCTSCRTGLEGMRQPIVRPAPNQDTPCGCNACHGVRRNGVPIRNSYRPQERYYRTYAAT
jgi:hypothetical protein